MRVHHLNCISSCPLGGKLMDGRTAAILRRGELCCHCLLVETEQGLDRQRFRPQQWSSKTRWKVYSPGHGEDWFGFECVRDLDGLPPEILLVPLPGHTYGHAGIAIRTPQRWIFQAGDAYFYHREMDLENPWCTPGLRLYQEMMEKDRYARLANQERLRRLIRSHRHEIEVFCAHDPVEYERLAGHFQHDPVGDVVTGITPQTGQHWQPHYPGP